MTFTEPSTESSTEFAADFVADLTGSGNCESRSGASHARRKGAVVSCGFEVREPCQGGLVRPLPVRCPQPDREERELPLAAREWPLAAREWPGVSWVRSALLCVSLVVGVLVAALLGAGVGGGEAATSAGSTYVVQDGDTVFSVAAALANSDHPADEVADWLTETRAGAPLRPGDRIRLG